MKTLKSTLLLLALCATSFFTGCEKKDDPDPRDAFVGTYEMEADCGQFGTDEDEITITKDTKDATQIIINSDQLEAIMGAEDIPATVTGTTFKLKSTTYNVEDEDGNPGTIKLTGDGSISGKNLTFNPKFNGNAVCEFEGSK